MVTPTKDEIVEEATRLYMEKNWKVSSNTPELCELKEGGFYNQARNDLMRSEGHEALSYLEELAAEAGYDLVKNKKATEYANDLETYPTMDIMKEGGFCVAGRGSGKSNLMKLLAIEALRSKIEMKVIDGTYLEKLSATKG
jgi:hypothetical protein